MAESELAKKLRERRTLIDSGRGKSSPTSADGPHGGFAGQKADAEESEMERKLRARRDVVDARGTCFVAGAPATSSSLEEARAGMSSAAPALDAATVAAGAAEMERKLSARRRVVDTEGTCFEGDAVTAAAPEDGTKAEPAIDRWGRGVTSTPWPAWGSAEASPAPGSAGAAGGGWRPLPAASREPKGAHAAGFGRSNSGGGGNMDSELVRKLQARRGVVDSEGSAWQKLPESTLAASGYAQLPYRSPARPPGLDAHEEADDEREVSEVAGAASEAAGSAPDEAMGGEAVEATAGLGSPFSHSSATPPGAPRLKWGLNELSREPSPSGASAPGGELRAALDRRRNLADVFESELGHDAPSGCPSACSSPQGAAKGRLRHQADVHEAQPGPGRVASAGSRLPAVPAGGNELQTVLDRRRCAIGDPATPSRVFDSPSSPSACGAVPGLDGLPRLWEELWHGSRTWLCELWLAKTLLVRGARPDSTREHAALESCGPTAQDGECQPVVLCLSRSGIAWCCAAAPAPPGAAEEDEESYARLIASFAAVQVHAVVRWPTSPEMLGLCLQGDRGDLCDWVLGDARVQVALVARFECEGEARSFLAALEASLACPAPTLERSGAELESLPLFGEASTVAPCSEWEEEDVFYDCEEDQDENAPRVARAPPGHADQVQPPDVEGASTLGGHHLRAFRPGGASAADPQAFLRELDRLAGLA